MRTTLNLDDDIVKAARSIARSRSISVGDAVSELARRGLEAENRITCEGGIPVFNVPPDAPPITLEDVKRIEDIP